MNNSSDYVDLQIELENLIIQDYDKLYACAFRMIDNQQDTIDYERKNCCTMWD